MKLNVGAYEIYYEVKGNLDADETIVFLNGVMASVTSWNYQVQALQKDYRIVCQDFKGQLLSDKPEGPYTFEEHAADVVAVLKHLNIDSAHLVGTSYGGEVAMKIAILHPSCVKSLTIIDSVSELDELLIANVKNWKHMAENAVTPQAKMAFFNAMSPSIYGSDFFANNKEMLESRAAATAQMDDSYFKGQCILYDTFISDVTMTAELNKISCPTLIVVGENDYLKPVKFSRIIHREIPSSEFVIIPDCGHVTIFEKYRELNSLLLGFLYKHSMK